MIIDAQRRAALAAALAEAHQRLDAWHDTALGVAAESEPGPDTLGDPRLEAAADAFHDAVGTFEEAHLLLLGMVPVEAAAVDEPDEEEPVLADHFSIDLVVGVPDVALSQRLNEVFDVVDEEAGRLVHRLEQAGFLVPQYAAGRGDADLPDDWDDSWTDEETL